MIYYGRQVKIGFNEKSSIHVILYKLFWYDGNFGEEFLYVWMIPPRYLDCACAHLYQRLYL